jgi:hypothetical protein
VVRRVLIEHHRPDELQIAGRIRVTDLGGAQLGGEDLRRALHIFDIRRFRKTAQKPGPAGHAPTAGSSIQQTGRVARASAKSAYGTPAA